MITIVTALFDGNNFGIPHTTGVYNASWVDKLYRGFKRNSIVPFEMVCLVDKEYNFEEPIRPVKFIEQNKMIKIKINSFLITIILPSTEEVV